jgi:hypothetical protein
MPVVTTSKQNDNAMYSCYILLSVKMEHLLKTAQEMERLS